MKCITITGIDKSGKSTLINEFMIATNYEHYVLDRDPSTFHFFNMIRDRIKNPEQCDKYTKFASIFRCVVDLAVFLRADDKDIEERFIQHNEPKLVGNLSIHDHQNQIEQYFDNVSYRKVLKLNTSELTIDQCVKEIMENIHANK